VFRREGEKGFAPIKNALCASREPRAGGELRLEGGGGSFTNDLGTQTERKGQRELETSAPRRKSGLDGVRRRSPLNQLRQGPCEGLLEVKGKKDVPERVGERENERYHLSPLASGDLLQCAQ